MHEAKVRVIQWISTVLIIILARNPYIVYDFIQLSVKNRN